MIRLFAKLVAITLFAAALTLSGRAQEGETIEGIVAIVNDQPISYSDVRERASLLLLTLGAQRPTQEQVEQITSQALDELIDEKLQLQEAAEYEVDVSEEDINNSIEDMARQSGLDGQGLLQVLREAGVDPQSLEAQMRAEIAWRRIMGGLYGSRIRISSNQIDERLNRIKETSQQTQYNLGEIFLFTANEEERQQALQGAQTIIEQLRGGAPFEVAAQRFSSAPTSAAGGDMGLVSLDDVDPAVAEAVQAMDEPGLSDPIPVDNGVYIIQYRGKRDPAETVEVVEMVRLAVANSSEEDLLAALAATSDCETALSVAEDDDNLNASELGQVRLSDLGPEARSMIDATEIGQHTDVMAMGGSLGVMYICDRGETGATLPTREEVENQLYGRQLSLISQRELRNLRRDATIIQRGS